jgi:hypothetical protein
MSRLSTKMLPVDNSHSRMIEVSKDDFPAPVLNLNTIIYCKTKDPRMATTFLQSRLFHPMPHRMLDLSVQRGVLGNTSKKPKTQNDPRRVIIEA